MEGCTHTGDLVEISDDDFERMVGEVFDALPDDMVRVLENVAILIANQPVVERPRLFGLYSGRPLKTRGVYGFGDSRSLSGLRSDRAGKSVGYLQ